MKDLRQVKMPFNVNLAGQKAALAALGDQEHLERTLSLNHEGKTHTGTESRAHGLRNAPLPGKLPLLPPAPTLGGGLATTCSAKGVIVRPLNRFDLDDWIRVTIGTPDQNAYFLSAIADLLRIK